MPYDYAAVQARTVAAKKAYREKCAGINRDKRLSYAGRKERLDEAHQAHQQEMQVLAAEYRMNLSGRTQEIQQALFGLGFPAGVDAATRATLTMSYRDALARAKAISTGAEAAREYDLAAVTSDAHMRQALATVAFQRHDDFNDAIRAQLAAMHPETQETPLARKPQGWDAILSDYFDGNDQAPVLIDELRELTRPLTPKEQADQRHFWRAPDAPVAAMTDEQSAADMKSAAQREHNADMNAAIRKAWRGNLMLVDSDETTDTTDDAGAGGDQIAAGGAA